MERIGHLLETDVNNFGGQPKEDDSSCQATGLNETGFTNETKVAEGSQGKLDKRVDNIFLDKEGEVSSISITSGDSKNCLSAIAEVYSSSDEELFNILQMCIAAEHMLKNSLCAKATAYFADHFCSHFNASGYTNRSKS